MSASYRFGSFVLDVPGYRVLHGETPLALSPKAIDLLHLFVRQPSTLLTKDEILAKLWPDVAVTDNALTQVVSELRQALGDRSSSPTFIQTVPRRGYRFVAGVGSVETTPPVIMSPPAPRLHVRETANLEAYRAFTEGRLKLETLDADQVEPAIADFERALALDGRYALAHVGIGHAHFWRFQASRARNRIDAGALTQAIAHVRRAIELDADLAEAHSALAFFLLGAERPIEAVAAGRRALALEPGNWRHEFRLGMAAWGAERLTCLESVLVQFPQMAYASFGIAMLHIARGDFARAGDVLTRGLAFEADATVKLERFPGKGLHWLLGRVRLALGDTAGARAELARELGSRARALFAEEFAIDAFDGLGYVLFQEGDWSGAAVMFGRALERYPAHARSLLGLAEARRRQGRQSEASGAFERVDEAVRELRQNGRQTEAAMVTAFGHALAGRAGDAVSTLDGLLAQTPPGLTGWTIPMEPFLAPLRGEPGFSAILQRLSDRAR
jgi:DNA-binding winged helix-turn-helix (wHTH) protein/Tfp pilus assembly protein PilF